MYKTNDTNQLKKIRICIFYTFRDEAAKWSFGPTAKRTAASQYTYIYIIYNIDLCANCPGLWKYFWTGLATSYRPRSLTCRPIRPSLDLWHTRNLSEALESCAPSPAASNPLRAAPCPAACFRHQAAAAWRCMPVADWAFRASDRQAPWCYAQRLWQKKKYTSAAQIRYQFASQCIRLRVDRSYTVGNIVSCLVSCCW